MKKLALLLFVFSLIACSKEAAPIHYGEEACDFCTMTIVDQSHSAQTVTHKGKNYKFDSSECMINFLEQEGNEKDMMQILSADYSNPGKMIDAREAHFLISENIPSPMGAFLSAIKEKSEAEKIMTDKGGALYNWEQIKTQITKP